MIDVLAVIVATAVTVGMAVIMSFYQIVDLVGSIDRGDRKSTRLNSSHQIISYAVFCLKKEKIDANPGWGGAVVAIGGAGRFLTGRAGLPQVELAGEQVGGRVRVRQKFLAASGALGRAR